MHSEPRAWYDARQAAQKQQWQELNLATPEQVSQVDAYRIQRGQLPTGMTQATTALGAQIARAQRAAGIGPQDDVAPYDPSQQRP